MSQEQAPPPYFVWYEVLELSADKRKRLCTPNERRLASEILNRFIDQLGDPSKFPYAKAIQLYWRQGPDADSKLQLHCSVEFVNKVVATCKLSDLRTEGTREELLMVALEATAEALGQIPDKIVSDRDSSIRKFDDTIGVASRAAKEAEADLETARQTALDATEQAALEAAKTNGHELTGWRRRVVKALTP